MFTKEGGAQTPRQADQELASIVNALHAEVMISDCNGIILQVTEDCEENYGIKAADILGKTVYELEEMGIIKPSIIAKAIERCEVVTMSQETKIGQQVVVTATPIMDADGNLEKVVSYSRNVTEYINLKKSYEQLRKLVGEYRREISIMRTGQGGMSGVVGNSKHLIHVMNTVEAIAPFDANVLITGESGVGKSMFAKIIHDKSTRRDGTLVQINCNSLPESLIESELFGYVKGAFTGANEKGKDGIIEKANGGTLFLDEIGDLPLSIQLKLLAVIQDKVFTKVGDTKSIAVDFRLIAATNANLENAIEAGTFRKDLYYRLNVIPLKIAPIRERRDDIFFIISDFLERYNLIHNTNKSISGEAMECLIHYDWPGNVREIQNVAERLIILSHSDLIEKEDLPKNIREGVIMRKNYFSLKGAVENLEKELLSAAYKKRGSVTGVADELSISQPTATRKLRKHGIL